MNAETNTARVVASPARRVGKSLAAEGGDRLVRKGDAGKLIVRCPRCKLNVKVAREEIPDE